MFPQVAPKFFADAGRGPEERRQGPGRGGRGRRPRGQVRRDGKGPVTGPVTYEVELGDKSHKVTVEPA